MTAPQLAPLLAAGVFVGSLFASTPTPLAASPAVPVDPAAGLTVVADAPPVPGYARLARFGSWASTGHGCDVRDVILARDLTEDVTRGCHVIGGKLADPYSGTVTVGPSSRLDIDHVRALDDAWQHGAAAWTDAQRRAFANDPAELRAVSAHDNRSKGDGGPDEWLPARDRCEYVEAYADVSRRYHLTVTVRQAAAIRGACA